MMVDLKRRKFLFKVKTQPVNSSSGLGEDEQHNTEVDRRMHSRKAKIAYLVGKLLQIKEKTRMEGGG
jgi:hypothetical protein